MERRLVYQRERDIPENMQSNVKNLGWFKFWHQVEFSLVTYFLPYFQIPSVPTRKVAPLLNSRLIPMRVDRNYRICYDPCLLQMFYAIDGTPLSPILDYSTFCTHILCDNSKYVQKTRLVTIHTETGGVCDVNNHTRIERELMVDCEFIVQFRAWTFLKS